jgi:hypothetical protein
MGGASAPRRDRRAFSRAAFEVPASAVRRRTSHDDPTRLVNVHILNVSRGGVGALVPEPFGTGEPVVVFFPPMGPRRGRDTHGRVVRCTESEGNYYVGIAFEAPWPEHEPIPSA